jgi:tetratricopeptide (TPR) repeat protein
MKLAKHGTVLTKRWFRAGLIVAFLAAAGAAASAQSTQKAPPKSPATAPAKKPAEKDDPLAPLLQQATAEIDKQNFAAALDPLQKYIAQRPDDAYAHFELGYAYVGLKRGADAKSEFTRAIALDPKMAAAYQNLGMLLMASDPAAAIDPFRRAADLQPTESHPRFLAGYCFEETGKLPEAIEQYRAALKITPGDYDSHFALGRVLSRTRDEAGAEEQFRAAVTARGDSSEARLALANILINEKKMPQAQAALTEYLKLKPEGPTAHYDRALALFELNRFDEAIAELDLFDAGGKANIDSLKMRADMYMQQRKWQEASDTLVRANQAAPQDAEVAEWMGHVRLQLHDYAATIRILGQVYSQNPQSVGALQDLADAYFLTEKYSETLEAMDRLEALVPAKPGSWFVRAICYDKLSRKAEAIDAYQKFLDQDKGAHDTQDFQARNRIPVLQRELGQSKNK